MALTVNHPTLKEQTVQAYTSSIATTPLVAYTRAPFRGTIVKVSGVNHGAVTTADCTVVVKVGTTTVAGASITITSTTAAGTTFSAVPTGLNTVNEDDVISFTPSGATGAAMPGTFFATIQTS